MTASSAESPVIRVRGAALHNLRDVDVDLPRGKLVVITGVSGSGKSSLAFDTIYAEGGRRFLQALAAGSQRRTAADERPSSVRLEGLPPMLAVAQRLHAPRVRSTVATLTEIHDYLRVLYARAGRAHCPACGTIIRRLTPQEVVSRILDLPAGSRLLLLAPIRLEGGETTTDVLQRIAAAGLIRARVDGALLDLAQPPRLTDGPHDVAAVVDRVILKPGLEARLQESVATALQLGDGFCLVSEQLPSEQRDHLCNTRWACPQCRTPIGEVEPRTFSFTSAAGACPACTGHGIVPDGTPCPDCGGTRLGPTGRNVTFRALTLPALLAQTIAEAGDTLHGWQSAATDPADPPSAAERAVTDRILQELTARLRYLARVGLAYLTLDRPGPTLSGGELQRVRLAGALGSRLVGVGYVLDEPTLGLHPRDGQRLWDALVELRDQRNTLLVVEHDPDLIRQADYIVDLGPGAGIEGGRVVAAGTSAEIMRVPESLTGAALAATSHARPAPTNRTADGPVLKLRGASVHNLQRVDVDVPLGRLVVVSGVSGSGKSSLVGESLVPLVRCHLNRQPPTVPAWGRLVDPPPLARLAEIDQSPLGRATRANPATYSGLWTAVRRLFAATREARQRGFGAAAFSFNSPVGRCPVCRGRGVRHALPDWLPELAALCPACRGARFQPAILAVRYRGASVADVLRLRVDAAAEFFAAVPAIARILQTFAEVGLGHLTLGQPADTLSGGEAQRVKLATSLALTATPGTLYVLDEPTAGLHPADVVRLLDLLRRLTTDGHSVLVIEHHLDVLSAADWIIDLGPEAGPHGGRIVGTGTPAQIATLDTPTGRALRNRTNARGIN